MDTHHLITPISFYLNAEERTRTQGVTVCTQIGGAILVMPSSKK
jgi:hypothetical protein